MFCDLWVLGGYGYWFCVDQSKSSMAYIESKVRCSLLFWTVDVSALRFSAVLLAWLHCVLLGSLTWLALRIQDMQHQMDESSLNPAHRRASC